MNSKNGLSEQYQIATIEATPGLCSQSLIFLMYMIHLSSIWVYLCIDITQINFHQFFQRILLNMFKHTIIQQEMLKITVLIKQRKCFLIVQLEIVDLHFWNSLDKTLKHCKPTKHFRNQLKSILLSEYN